MTSRKISRRELLSSCADIGTGDGRDPRDHARAKVRIEAVAAINRWRVPDLLFRVRESGR